MMTPKMSKNCRKPRARNPVEKGPPQEYLLPSRFFIKITRYIFVLSIKHSLGLPSNYHQIIKVSPNVCVCICQ
nr:MAG TPA: hypothetical protein [Bacteriophage sp.]